MNKNDLIKLLKDDDLSLKEEQIEKALDSFFEFLTESILKGFRVEIRGFGVFKIKQRICNSNMPCLGHNWEKVKKNCIFFKPSKYFKYLLKND